MQQYHSHYIKNLLIPCFVFSLITGVISSLLIIAFKIASGSVIHLSEKVYGLVRENPLWLPVLILAVAALGFVGSLIISYSHSCRGGGIPTSIAAIRGIVNFNWIKTIILLPVSALITFFAGLPLGTEGPCVQMGTAVGDGVVGLVGGKKYRGWRRYMMVGGAASGFALATGSPITAMLFSIEELHKKISPLLFSVVSMSVIVSQVISELFSSLGIVDVRLFDINLLSALPLKLIFIPALIGLLSGGVAILFIKLYNLIDVFVKNVLSRLNLKIKLPIIFALVSSLGFFFSKILGTGHGLIEIFVSDDRVRTDNLWYLLIIVFIIRAMLMMLSNTVGITGGIFLPTLSFGAILGTLTAEAFISLNLISEEYYALMVVFGIAAFLGASMRIPVTACIFAIETLGGFYNILPLAISVTLAFLMVEVSGLSDFTSTVISARTKAIHRGKTPHVIEVPLTVYAGSFVIDKDIRDILWPASCTLLSIERGPNKTGKLGIAEGDILTVHYTTYDPVITANEFEVLVGDQSEEIDKIMRPDVL